MKAKAALLGILSIGLIVSIAAVSAPAHPILIVFHEEGCPDCEEMDDLIAGMMIDMPETAIARYEITEPGSMEMLLALTKTYDIEIPSTVPIVFVADDVIIGMGRAQEFTLRNAIGDCLSIGCESPIARLPISQLRVDLPRLALFLVVFLAIAWFQLH